MKLYDLRYEDILAMRDKLPPGLWNKIRKLPKDYEDPESVIYYPERGGLTSDELNALILYKSYYGRYLQRALNKKKNLMDNKELENISASPDLKDIITNSRKSVPLMDNLLSKHKLPDELANRPLYRGTRISYGTALIKSGKKPGDIIRDPRYQSFSLDPRIAMFHTAKSQSGDEPVLVDSKSGKVIRRFNPRKKVLLEHFVKEGETGLYLGNEDQELEVIYPRNKRWRISDVRSENVRFPFSDGYMPVDEKVETQQNVRIYTIERKKKKIVRKKPVQRKKIIKPKRKCRCKK